MSVNRNKKTGKWDVYSYYTDAYGKRKQKHKSGFERKKDALEWEREFEKKKNLQLDMTFGSFTEIYMNNQRIKLKESTMATKENIIETKILPFFKDRRIDEIKAADVIAWQTEIVNMKDKNGRTFAPTYIKTIHNQLSAIFNYAMSIYGLQNNPARQAGSIGEKEAAERNIWSKEQFQVFIDSIVDNEPMYYLFRILYWTGIRKGECLALTPADFNFENNTMKIRKTYQVVKKKKLTGTPKTDNSYRVVKLPQFLAEEMKLYLEKLYGITNTEKIFKVSPSSVNRVLKRGIEKTGLPYITVHDLRHSHVSLLAQLHYTSTAIGKRIGHESVEITRHYMHMFPEEQEKMAESLDLEQKELNEYE